jgi:4-hydroxy-L-threonine phosphate dehydrogenase PdxA
MSLENAYRPLLGITMGDPGGIGPEICAKALDSPEIYDLCRPLVIGETDIMADAVSFSGLSLDIAPVDNIETAPYRHGAIDVLSLGMLRLSELQLKTVSAAQGLASFTYIERAIELAMAGTIDGTVTGPINKAAINAAGLHYAGHTEIYGRKPAPGTTP